MLLLKACLELLKELEAAQEPQEVFYLVFFNYVEVSNKDISNRLFFREYIGIMSVLLGTPFS